MPDNDAEVETMAERIAMLESQNEALRDRVHSLERQGKQERAIGHVGGKFNEVLGCFEIFLMLFLSDRAVFDMRTMQPLQDVRLVGVDLGPRDALIFVDSGSHHELVIGRLGYLVNYMSRFAVSSVYSL